MYALNDLQFIHKNNIQKLKFFLIKAIKYIFMFKMWVVDIMNLI